MIAILSNGGIFVGVLTAARMRLMKALDVEQSDIEIQVVMKDGVPWPVVKVDYESTKTGRIVVDDLVGQTMKLAQRQLSERLVGNKSAREDYKKA